MALRIARYKQTRHWALYDGPALVVVIVYRRGALAVLRRLQAQELHAAAADAAAAARPTARRREPRRDQRECHGAARRQRLGLACAPARFSGQAAAIKLAAGGALSRLRACEHP